MKKATKIYGLVLPLLIMALFSNDTKALDISCGDLNCSSTNESLIDSYSTSNQSKLIKSKDLTGVDTNLMIRNTSGRVVSKLNGNIENLSISSQPIDLTLFDKNASVLDIVTNLSLSSTGVSGINGKDTAKICSENFLDGAYGTAAYTFFVNRHTINSATVCDNTDYNYLLTNKFSCDGDFLSTNVNTKSVAILDSKRACRANIVQNMCVKKTYNIQCKQKLMGLSCCSSGSLWSSLINNTLPHSFLLNTVGASCSPSNCSGQYNGYEVIKTYEGDAADLANSNFCPSKTSFNTPSLSYGTGVYSTNMTINAITRNNVSLTLPTVRNSSGDIMTPSDYSFFISNVAELNGTSTTVRNCMGLDGSTSNDYICDIKPGPAISIKLKAVDKFGNFSSNSVSISITESIHIAARKSNSYHCLVESYDYNGYCQTEIVGTSIQNILSNGQTTGAFNPACSSNYYYSYPNFAQSVYSSNKNFRKCSTNGHYQYDFNKVFQWSEGWVSAINTIYVKSYSESLQSGLRIYSDFSGNF